MRLVLKEFGLTVAEVLYFRTTALPSSGRGVLVFIDSSVCEEASMTVLGADFQALMNFGYWVSAVEMDGFGFCACEHQNLADSNPLAAAN